MKTNRKTRGLPNGEASFNNLYLCYKKASIKRGYKFLLSKDEFKNLTKKRCFYCNIEPEQAHTTSVNGSYIYNGIDRVDNSIGYTLENCVPCCGTCNRAKDTMTQEQFINWINKIHNNFIYTLEKISVGG